MLNARYAANGPRSDPTPAKFGACLLINHPHRFSTRRLRASSRKPGTAAILICPLSVTCAYTLSRRRYVEAGNSAQGAPPARSYRPQELSLRGIGLRSFACVHKTRKVDNF